MNTPKTIDYIHSLAGMILNTELDLSFVTSKKGQDYDYELELFFLKNFLFPINNHEQWLTYLRFTKATPQYEMDKYEIMLTDLWQLKFHQFFTLYVFLSNDLPETRDAVLHLRQKLYYRYESLEEFRDYAQSVFEYLFRSNTTVVEPPQFAPEIDWRDVYTQYVVPSFKDEYGPIYFGLNSVNPPSRDIPPWVIQEYITKILRHGMSLSSDEDSSIVEFSPFAEEDLVLIPSPPPLTPPILQEKNFYNFFE